MQTATAEITTLPTAKPATVGTTADRLRNFTLRIERLEEEKKALADDIKEVFSEVKGEGFDVKILRKVIALRKKDPEKRAEEDELLQLYMDAVDGKQADKADPRQEAMFRG